MAISTITFNNSTQQFEPPNLAIDRTQKTIFLIHGFQSNPEQAFGKLDERRSLSASLQAIEPQANIINVDWSGVASWANYIDVVNSMRTYVAQALSNTFKTLNIDPTKTEIIGHSLGAHLAGIAGQEFKADGSPPINQIIGLDPAGVLYENIDPAGLSEQIIEPHLQISPDDAQRVVVFHSSNSLTGYGSNKEWGLGLYRDGSGHLDIYIKQYGQVYGKSIADPNDHDLAVDVYTDLVKGLMASGSNEFGSELRFNDFVNLQKLNDPNLTGEYTINLDTKFTSDATNQSFSSNGVNNNDTYSFDTDFLQGVDTINETTVALKTAHNSYVRADAGPGLFQSGDLGLGEEFEIVQQDDGKIALKTYQNLYVRAAKFWVVDHVSREIGPWEKFEVIDRGNGNIGLKTHWGDSYLQAFPFGNGLGTISQSWNLGDWETFTPIAQNQDVDILDFSETATQSISVDLSLPGQQQINENLALTLGTTLAGVSYVDIENASGGSLNDTLSGNHLNNFLQGNGGDDTLSGSAGNDLLYGAAGSDTANYFVYGATQGINVSLLDSSATNDGFGNQDTLSGIDNIFGSQNNDNIVGDDLNNTLNGFTGNDTLVGSAGDDFLYGAEGDDTLAGSVGNDALYGVEGNDTASYFVFGVTQGINVSLLDGLAIDDGFGNQDTLSGVDNILGSLNNDNIVGDDLNNTLDGSAGSDTLTGLGGADTFVLSSPEDLTIETITDFSSAQGDKINIAPGSSVVSLDQFSYNPGDGTLSFQGVAYAILSSLPQDFNVQTDINLPPLPAPTFPIGL